MAVRFLLGPAGSGKTQYCLDRLRNLEREGRPGIYLVPEQFTFSADRELLGPPDLHGLRHVRVLSFTRFAWWMRERAGEALLPTVDSAVRPMILRSVLERMNPEVLGPLASMRGRPGVLLQLSRFVGEVRNHGPIDFLDAIEVSRLELTARSVDPDRSSADAAVAPAILQKLHSLAEVYGAYATRLREMKRLDPEEQLFGLEPLLAADSGLPDLTIYVDGFLSWTRREAELLAALAKHGVALEIALCCDPRERELPRVPFRPVWRSLEQVSSRFGRAGVTVEESRTFPGDHPTRFRAALLSDIERRLYPHVLL
ncbi:MAG: hypothetical protein KC729_05120, partial [Candidatus Eisenbacteria bacterium]|nr:hypothetical protein [Candidatus Eisenbacteria bacterium]